MSQDKYGSRFVNNADKKLTGTWTYQGETSTLVVKNIGYPDWKLVQQYGSLASGFNAVEESASDDPEQAVEVTEELASQADDLDNFSWEAPDEDPDFMVSLIEEKLIDPDVDVSKTSRDVLAALIDGMIAEWAADDDIQAAHDEMPVDEGNA